MKTEEGRTSGASSPLPSAGAASSRSSPDMVAAEAQGQVLLPIARAAISRALNLPRSVDETAPWLSVHGACFVTLTQEGELRGCIGTLRAHRPLLADVKDNAVAAALHDPRFMPLGSEELDIVAIEISLLSPTTEMNVLDEADALAQMRPGIDGIVFQYGQHRSTFLPQVWEHFPHPRDFLAMLKRKAGLPDDFWTEDVKLSSYTVKKWSEAR